MTTITNKRAAHGFTLIEMLTVVALIGLAVAVAVSSWSGNNAEVKAIKDRRNAQTIATIAASASVAGAPFVVSGDIPATIQNLANGTSGSAGGLKGREFKLPAMAPQEINGAMNYLRWNGDHLMYQR